MSEEGLGKNNRILAIYTKLMNGQIVKKAEEAEWFGVNVKSIQRDLEGNRAFLAEQSVQEGTHNELVYDYYDKGYRIEQSSGARLTNDEILAVCKILLSSRAFTKKEMMSILDKLLVNCVPKKDKKLISDLIVNEKFHYIEP